MDYDDGWYENADGPGAIPFDPEVPVPAEQAIEHVASFWSTAAPAEVDPAPASIAASTLTALSTAALLSLTLLPQNSTVAYCLGSTGWGYRGR